jgi:SAM-dependent MidA family methyltransferase
VNALGEQLRQEIAARGPLPFAEFMQRALYDPEHGYYTRSLQQTGKRGDFFTSVSVGSFFGELLAFQFARWIEALMARRNASHPSPFQIVEAGAHDGQLAQDILVSLRAHEPAIFKSIEYWIIEPSAARRAVQQKNLARFSEVRWFESWPHAENWKHALPESSSAKATRGGDPDKNIFGIIFSNELLDAMPVHPFAWSASTCRWEEMGVAFENERFIWMRLPTKSVPPPQFPAGLLDVLPDGYAFELSPAAAQWWRQAATALAEGKLITIDYGGVLEELLSPSRTTGTLRAYSGHRLEADVLKNPGEQDITAHVNFSEIRRVGEAAGLRTDAFTRQSQFLTNVARDLWTHRGSWPAEQVRQFQTLTHPEHLGRPFRVLVQSR